MKLIMLFVEVDFPSMGLQASLVDLLQLVVITRELIHDDIVLVFDVV